MNRLAMLEDYGMCDDGVIPPNPFGSEPNSAPSYENIGNSHGSSTAAEEESEEEHEHEYDNETELPKPCIEKLGLGIGVMIGITIQLSTLAGTYVDVMVWGSDDGPYASTTFFLWCCFMCSMFFLVFGLLRFLVQMSFQMVYKMEEDSTVNAPVADVPSDSPMPSLFPAGRHRLYPLSRAANQRINISDSTCSSPRDHVELLDEVMFHMKCHYILGISIGVSLSWIGTNVLLGGQRVSLWVALAPTLLGMFWCFWMKRDHAYSKLDDTTYGEEDWEEGSALV